ncbi:two component system sensor kinase [Dongshaea marina]|uniref:two component system sensor kinase n=1 Tax=Dongshaea marina TaxID=2047966 RepID=UPI00131EEAF3|nr:two component system sensor kinase [Dongshaea marina]
MKLSWKASFVTRLTLRLMIIIGILWCIGQFTAIYSYYNIYGFKWDQLERYNLKVTLLQAERESISFKNAQIDIRYVASIWQDLRKNRQFQLPDIKPGSMHIYPDKFAKNPSSMMSNGAKALQLIGLTSPNGYLDGFIWRKDEWVTIYSFLHDDGKYLSQRRASIYKLVKSQPNSQGFIWGNPSYNQDLKTWSVPVARELPDQDGHKILIGFTLSLSDFIDKHTTPRSSITNVITNQKGKILTLLNSSLNQKKYDELLRHHDEPEDSYWRTDNYLISQASYYGPPWKLVRLDSISDIKSREVEHFYAYLPFGIISLAILAIILLLTLQYSLAKPLRKFVGIIKATGPEDFKFRLPYNRRDELGMIAKAYNQLLSTIEYNYQNLEAQVELRTEELRHARIAAEKANELKSEHLTMISHEVRTPLNGIIGALDLMESNPYQDNMRLVQTAQRCSQSLLEMINNLLDFRRIEEGQMQLTLSQCTLLSLIDQVALMILPRLQHKKLEFDVLIEKEVPHSLMLDSLRVRQILVNLLANALKFTDEGRIFLRVSFEQEWLRFSLQDTGIGITSESLSHIFEPFVREHSDRVGTGLGLPISRTLAHLMKGEIEAQSKLGVGSTFTLKLPVSQAQYPTLFSGKINAPHFLHKQLCIWGFECEQSNLEDSPLAAPEYRYLPGVLWKRLQQLLQGDIEKEDDFHGIPLQPWSLKILLVDDVESNREIIGQMLESFGNQVVIASSGEAALEAGNKHIFDLVLMDIRMEGMDGVEAFLKWTNEDSQVLDPECPIIALTANTLPEEQNRIAQAGFFDYVTKPVNMSKLSQILAQVIDFQQERGVELLPNEKLEQPLLNMPALIARARKQLLMLLLELSQALESADWDECRHTLHAMKGCAGQGGYTEVQEYIEILERQLQVGDIFSVTELELLESMLNDISD